MPQLALPIPDVYVSITRPVNVSIIRAIMNVTGISEDTFIEYSGENESVPTWRTTLDQATYDQTANAKFPFFQKVKVDYQEEVNDDSILSTAHHYNDNMVCWFDKKRQIIVSPFREQVKGTLNFTYRTVDKNAAQNWRTMMRRKIMRHFIDETFNAGYHYVLPVQVVAMLGIFHKMKETVSGDGDTLKDYIKNHAVADITTAVDNAGNNETYIFREQQLDILGNFEFSAPPMEEKLPDGNCYDISFTYRFSYDRPVGMVVKYPLVIHNQMVPPGLRLDRGLYAPERQPGLSSASTRRYYEMFKKAGLWSDNVMGGNIVPYFDDWFPTQAAGDTTPLVQFLIQVNPEEPQKVLDLTSLGKHKFNDLLLSYMREVHLDLPRASAAAVHISLYANDRPFDSRDLFIDENLVIWSQVPLEVTKTYHVRVSLFTQLIVLQPSAARHLRENPSYLNMIIDGLDPTFKDHGTYPVAIHGKVVSKEEYFRVARELAVTAKRFYSVIYRSILCPTVLSYLFQSKE